MQAEPFIWTVIAIIDAEIIQLIWGNGAVYGIIRGNDELTIFCVLFFFRVETYHLVGL